MCLYWIQSNELICAVLVVLTPEINNHACHGAIVFFFFFFFFIYKHHDDIVAHVVVTVSLPGGRCWFSEQVALLFVAEMPPIFVQKHP